jgi:hypothetical protein
MTYKIQLGGHELQKREKRASKCLFTKKGEKTGNNTKPMNYLVYKSKGINISNAGKHTVLCKPVITPCTVK